VSGGAKAACIDGFCAPGFEEVREAFERNFEVEDEVGAAVAICVDGKPVVDLWGGLSDRGSGRAWTQDTVVTIYSCTKGLVALCLHLLIDRGQLDVDLPVAHYWPEFAANGKAGVTVAMVMSHQAGLPVWQEELPPNALLDWDLVTRRLAGEAPLWEPGTQHGYHAATIGFLLGELVRRITGRTIGVFFRDEIAGPLGADAWIGLPETEEHRVATVYPHQIGPDSNSAMIRKLMTEPEWYGWKIITNTGGDSLPDAANAKARRAAEIPASGGVATARALARIYAPVSRDGSVDGVRLVRPEGLAAMRAPRSASDCDVMLRLPTVFTLGFSKCWGHRDLGPGEHVILGEQAFGAPGLGGSLGFADGEAGLSFGYVMNNHGGGVSLNGRGQGLVDAAYRSIGYRQSSAGFWVR